MMRFGSICSGIEAASCAWLPLGWQCQFMSEIEAFPRAVLKHHYADTPLHGDFTTIKAGDYEPIDLLVGGTPCQSFSVAGLRGGMADARGNLALEYLRLADRLRPQWLVWENVPGVLSSNGGRDFGSFLGGLGQLGYGFAYRVLDAQYFGLAQRRKRVFVVGHLGDWRCAAAVLFEPASMRWDTPPCREAGERIARCLANGTGSSGGQRYDGESEDFVVSDTLRQHTRPGSNSVGTLAIAPSLTSNPYGDHESREGLLVAHSLRADGFDASEDGTGRGTPLVPVYALQERAACENPDAGPDGAGWRGDGAAYTLEARSVPQAIAIHSDAIGRTGDAAYRKPGMGVSEPGEPMYTLDCSGGHAVAFDLQQITSAANRTRVGADLPASTLNAAGGMHVAFQTSQSGVRLHNTHATLDANNGPRRHNGALIGSAVRRLTPRECERLQGFPDDYTLISYRGKPAADGPRYKALGNSMAVPVMAWIGRRIQLVQLGAMRVAA